MKKLFFMLTCVMAISLTFANNNNQLNNDYSQELKQVAYQIQKEVDRVKVQLMGDHIELFALSIIKGHNTIESLNNMENIMIEKLVDSKESANNDSRDCSNASWAGDGYCDSVIIMKVVIMMMVIVVHHQIRVVLQVRGIHVIA